MSKPTVWRRWPAFKAGAAPRCVASAAATVLLATLKVGAAQAQALWGEEDVIPLIDTPLMQVPMEQGTQALTGSEPAVVAPTEVPPLTDERFTRALCDQVVEQISQAQVGSAFSLLEPHWPLATTEQSRLAAQTHAQLTQLVLGYGNIVGFEWVQTRRAGKSLVQHLYLIKLQAHGLRLACTFYRPMEHWQVHTVFWDDEIDTLLEP